MSSPRHSSGSGFGSSAGGAAVRGAIVIGIALVVGFLLLNQGIGDNSELPPSEAASPGDTGGTDATTDTTVPPATSSVPTSPTTVTPTTTPPRPANEVRVLVANGARVDGAAGRLAETIRAQGYTTLDAVDATEPADTTAILFLEGFEPEAARLAGELGAPAEAISAQPATLPITEARDAADLVVILGRDLAQSG